MNVTCPNENQNSFECFQKLQHTNYLKLASLVDDESRRRRCWLWGCQEIPPTTLFPHPFFHTLPNQTENQEGVHRESVPRRGKAESRVVVVVVVVRGVDAIGLALLLLLLCEGKVKDSAWGVRATPSVCACVCVCEANGKVFLSM